MSLTPAEALELYDRVKNDCDALAAARPSLRGSAAKDAVQPLADLAKDLNQSHRVTARNRLEAEVA